MMILTRQIPTEKGDWKSLQEAAQTVQKRLQHGERVLIFPEFKRCEGNFEGVNPYSMLPFQIALHEKVKILPLVVYGTDHVWPKGSLNLNTKPKQRVIALEAIDTKLFESAQELRDKVYSMTQNKVMELCHEV
jgi:1-acyl-sn-glycerol-3-phosphate acyltransferase